MIFRRSIKVSLITVFLLLSISLNSWADTKSKYETIYDNCVKEAGTINNGVVGACSGAVSEAVKKDMDTFYNTIHKNISERSADDAKKFESSQKSWIKYRNDHCELMGSYVGSPMYSYCPMQLNKLRVSELRELAGED